MKVNVAGAGAGKTTSMANLITGLDVPAGMVVFCIAFTNSAVENIQKKVEATIGAIPNNIKIGTIHSFLYKELIKPYYYFLFGKHFERLSSINLPENESYKRAKTSELEADGILHISKIPEKAKWVTYKKSTDKKATKELRKQILHRFSDYCRAIFVDEAQDIDKDMRFVLESLEREGVEIILYGDPKQDVKGYGQFRKIIDETEDVNYISECHRCPQRHLLLSNILASKEEKQKAVDGNKEGSIEIVFESHIADMKRFISEGNYGLQYISHKNDRFNTHGEGVKGTFFETLHHEVYKAMTEKREKELSDIELKRFAFYITEQMLDEFDGNNASTIVSRWTNGKKLFNYNPKRYVAMIEALQVKSDSVGNIPVVQSIEIVKGLEAERCLFILSSDLAPYMFGDKTEDNKTKHLLYVALTRALNHLTILITEEVEQKYQLKMIQDFFNRHISVPL